MHVPVLCEEVINTFSPFADGVYLDATFGAGGHSKKILEQLPATARLVGLDCDQTVEQFADEIKDPRFSFIHGNFANLSEIAEQHQLGQLQGILMDLGVSSMQLNDPERGFSFRGAGPLDMRMDQSNDHKLDKWLRKVNERQLGAVIRKFGQEKNWRQIAASIIARRAEHKLKTTADLAAACSLVSRGIQKIHPATRTFQALRIFHNRELTKLNDGLLAAAKLLVSGGKLAVISFHSIEDGITKKLTTPTDEGLPALMRRCSKLIRPSEEEINRNPRSRSARLRISESI